MGMQLLTPVSISPSNHKIGYQDRILMLGSCFADEIAARFNQAYWQVTSNPLGTLYNPLSIADALTNQTEIQLVEYGGMWHSMRHHGSFSSPDYDATLRNCVESVASLARALSEASVVIITFGTAWVYEQQGRVVANCHKMPADSFVRRRLSVDEIVRAYAPILHQYPDKHFIFTVSPIRHVRDGLHDNQVSKAILLQAIDQLGVDYFPSYEIVLDELRDYRFYAEDMVHPSPLAVEYIWNRFSDTYFSDSTRQDMAQLHQLWLDEHHTLLHPDSPEAQRFIARTKEKRTLLRARFPWL